MKWFARKARSAALGGEVLPETVTRRVEITVEREVRWTLHRDRGAPAEPASSEPAACPVCGQALPATTDKAISDRS